LFRCANAAECAADQGQFAEYHDALFANQDSLRLERWASLARLSHVANIPAFEKCVQHRSFQSRIDRDVQMARSAAVYGTPTFVFRDRLVSGGPGLAKIQLWLDSAVASAR
jgi:protein-disulfide isomerase